MIDCRIVRVNVDHIELSADFTFPGERMVSFENKLGYRLPKDENNPTILVHVHSVGTGPEEKELQYSCDFGVIASYSEKPEDMTEFVNRFCRPLIDQEAERIFANIMKALGKITD